MGRRNLDAMRATDLAWNERRWEDYASLFDDTLAAFASGAETSHNKSRHVDRAKAFCAAFPDAHLHTSPYIDLFISHDGAKTCCVAVIAGTMDGPIDNGSLIIEPTHRKFRVTLMAISRWRGGKILEQREFFDTVLFARQLALPYVLNSEIGALHLTGR